MSANGYVRFAAYVLQGARVRLLGQPWARMRDFAVQTIEVCPAETGTMAPPVTLPGQLDRVTGTAFGAEIATYRNWAVMTSCEHGATLLYRVQNVFVDNGLLYKGMRVEHVSSLGWPRFRAPKATVAKMLLASSQSGSGFFGDWLSDDSLLELLAKEVGIPALKLRHQTRFPHLEDISRLLELTEPFTDLVKIENLYIADDIGFNRNKRNRLRSLRATLRRNLQRPKPGSKLVYLRRGEGHQSVRRLVNETEVQDSLKRRGFKILDPTRMSAVELLSVALDSSIVVGVEGSQLAYGFLALKEGGLMISLQPPFRFHTSWRPRCVFADVNWGFLVGMSAPGGFTMPLRELEQLLDRFI